MKTIKKILVGACLIIFLLSGVANAQTSGTSDEGWWVEITLPSPVEPQINMSMTAGNARWENYNAYVARRLTVSFAFTNASEDNVDVSIDGFIATNGANSVDTFPAPLGNVPIGGTVNYNAHFYVPYGVGAFRITVFVVANHDTTFGYFPYPMP